MNGDAAEGSDEPLLTNIVSIELPVVHDDASKASQLAQARYLRWSAIRFGALLTAAASGALEALDLGHGVFAVFLLVSFSTAAFAEVNPGLSRS
jgi:hypothetical protein